MTVNVHTKTTATLEHADLPFTPDLKFVPCAWIDPVVTKRDGAPGGVAYTIAYAVHDEYVSGDFHPIIDRGVVFEQFTTEWERDEFIAEQDDSDHVFIVNHYEHSGHVYSVAGTPGQPIDPGGWDTRPSGVLVVPDDYTDPEVAAVALMAEYTSWVNGDVYCVVREDYDANGELIAADNLWGFIGSDYTETVVANVDEYL